MTLRCLFMFSLYAVLKIFVVSCATKYYNEKNMCFHALFIPTHLYVAFEKFFMSTYVQRAVELLF